MKSFLNTAIICFLFSLGLSAQITINKTTGCAPLTNVQVSAPQAGNWNFGNGTSAINTNSATATYSAPGIYSIVYRVGGVPQDTVEVTVYGNPSPAFSLADSAGCAPFTANFTDNSIGGGNTAITAWSWSFGDGGVASSQNPNYQYTFTGSYPVSLTVTDENGCDSSITVNNLVSVGDPPNASFSTSPNSTVSCNAPLAVTFSNNSTNSTGGTSNLTYDWDFGNGETSTSANPETIDFITEGAFTVRLTVNETGSCSDVTTKNVVIGKPTASISVPDTICIWNEIFLTHNSIGGNSFRWIIDSTTTINQSQPLYTFNTPGEHTLDLIVSSSGGCADTTTKTIFVQQVFASFDRTPTLICDDPYCVDYSNTSTANAISFLWSVNGGGTVSTQEDPTVCYPVDTNEYVFHPRQLKNVQLIAISKFGCRDTVVNRDTVFPTTAILFPDTFQGCVPFEVEFSDESLSEYDIVSWDWDFGDGNTSNLETPTHTYADTGVYAVTLIVEDQLGCRDTSYDVIVEVGDQLDLSFALDQMTVCINDTILASDLTNDPSLDYFHFDAFSNATNACPESPNQSLIAQDGIGDFDLTYYADFNGCITDTVVTDAITVEGAFGEFYFRGDCENPLTYSFIGSFENASEWVWDFGDGDSVVTNTEDSVVHTFPASGDYTITLKSRNNGTGCDDFVFTREVNVRQIEAVITMDSILCLESDYTQSSANSIDVDKRAPSAYQWDLGVQTPPSFTRFDSIISDFDTLGNYTVRLIAKDINGCKDTTVQNVRVTQLVANIGTNDYSGCLPFTVNLVDSSVSDTLINSWFWTDDSDVTSDFNTSSGSFTYTDPSDAAINIYLRVTDTLGCTDRDTVTVRPILPDTNFTASPRNICLGDSVRFTPSGGDEIASFTWDFGDGTNGVVDDNPWHTYDDSTGFLDITLNIVDTNGCVGSRTRSNYISVQSYPEAGFETNFDTVNTICYPVTINFTDTSVSEFNVAYQWDLGTGGQVVPQATVGRTYNQPGLYDIEMIVRTSNGCRDTATRQLNIVGPVADFDFSDNNICVGDEITFTIKDTSDVEAFLWDFGDGTTQGAVSPVTNRYDNVPDGGSTVVQLITYSEDSVCEYVREKTINIEEVEARFGFVDSTICLDETLMVVDSSIGVSTRSWDFDNGVTSVVASPSPVSYASSGSYTVRLIVENTSVGCIDTLERIAIVHPLPDISLPAFAVCEDDSVQVSASGAEDYSWSPSELFEYPDSNLTWMYPTSSVQYSVTGIDSNQCSRTASNTMTVYGPFNEVTNDTCVVIGQTFTIGNDRGAGYTYDWSNSEEPKWLNCEDCPVQQDLQVTEEEETLNFILEFTDTLGCYTSRINYDVCILESYSFNTPDAFTPDGDGVNDVIYLRGHGIESLEEFKIFNRWGELVFETNDIEEGWDGIYKGKLQHTETFVYKATVVFFNGMKESKSGSFTLIR